MSSFYTSLTRIGNAARESTRRRRRGCWLKFIGCLGLLTLFSILLIALLFGLISNVGAQGFSPEAEDLAVQLVIDNSNSMFDKDGVGSDPELLRQAAARLFIEYLGVDDSRFTPSAGLIFFGSEASQPAAPAPLADPGRRAALLAHLDAPERMGWTDHLAALQLARQGLSDASGRRVIILLTDGKPEWSELPSLIEQVEYRNSMALLGRELGEQGVTLFIILLAGPATDHDSEITEIWEPMWRAMVAETEEGRFRVIRDAEELPAVYHEIVVALTGHQSDGVVIDEAIAAQGLHEEVAVEPGLARLKLVVRKSHPDTVVTIQLPDGSSLAGSGSAGQVRYTSGLLEEIWAVSSPTPGTWIIAANGEGRLTVWKDYVIATPTPLPSPTATAILVASPTVLPSPTPAPSPTTVPTAVPSPTTIAAPIIEQAPPAPTSQSGPGGAFPWWLLWMPGLLLSAVAGVFVMRRRGMRPVVTGTLHAPGESGSTSFDLYALGKPSITIGASDADIPLPTGGPTLTLEAVTQANGEPEIIVHASQDVLHNGRRLLSNQPVFDGDTFTIGQIRLRYENLQRRRAQRRELGRRKLHRAAPYISK